MRMAALALGIVVAATACASKGTAASDQSPTASTTRNRTYVITSQEIRESRAANVADLIRQSRPGWPTQVTIFVNENPDPIGLQRSPATVSEIRYLTRSEAQMKWGSRFQEVIQIITR